MSPEQAQAKDAATLELTLEDVDRLKADPSVEVRADMAAKVAAQFDRPRLDDRVRRIAEDILRAMVLDAEVRVRENLARHLKSSPNIPHDVALALAKDFETVALPILKYSEVLSDEDLIEIVRAGNAAKQVAIAQRPKVSTRVAGVLIDTGNERAVARLVANEGADLDDRLLGRVMKEYRGSAEVCGYLVRRPKLPATIARKLMPLMTEHVKSHLAEQHGMPIETLRSMFRRAQERATVSLLSEDCSSDAEFEALMERLHAKGELNTSLAMRALSMGDLRFFEAAMARLAGIRLENARTLINDKGQMGLDAILETALKAQRR